jgi:hypothetical protein
MEAVQPSETSVNSYQNTRRYNPEDGHLDITSSCQEVPTINAVTSDKVKFIILNLSWEAFTTVCKFHYTVLCIGSIRLVAKCIQFHFSFLICRHTPLFSTSSCTYKVLVTCNLCWQEKLFKYLPWNKVWSQVFSAHLLLRKLLLSKQGRWHDCYHREGTMWLDVEFMSPQRTDQVRRYS